VGEAGANQRTPELAGVVQEIVTRSDWASGNAMVFIITGTGHRTAESFEGKAAAAALLHVEYSVAGAPAQARAEAAATPEPRLELGLRPLSPNPTRGPLRVELSLLAGEGATLELLDVAGRRVVAREVGWLGPGRHEVEMTERLPAGIYLLRLRQGSRARLMKVVVLR